MIVAYKNLKANIMNLSNMTPLKAIQPSQVYTLNETVQYVEGSTVSKIITRNEKGNLTLFAFDAGQNLSEHAAPFDALVQVLEGVGIIYINKEKHILKEGQMIIMPANIPHAVEAVERFKMLLIMIKA
jgi:quercetin dioxygenase-like cupin family protein